jgi:hypothetical protein
MILRYSHVDMAGKHAWRRWEESGHKRAGRGGFYDLACGRPANRRCDGLMGSISLIESINEIHTRYQVSKKDDRGTKFECGVRAGRKEMKLAVPLAGPADGHWNPDRAFKIV